MTFPVNYDKFTILSKVQNYITIRIFRRANITHKPTFSFGGHFSSVTLHSLTIQMQHASCVPEACDVIFAFVLRLKV